MNVVGQSPANASCSVLRAPLRTDLPPPRHASEVNELSPLRSGIAYYIKKRKKKKKIPLSV